VVRSRSLMMRKVTRRLVTFTCYATGAFYCARRDLPILHWNITPRWLGVLKFGGNTVDGMLLIFLGICVLVASSLDDIVRTKHKFLPNISERTFSVFWALVIAGFGIADLLR
jgi:hypothetical protein